jgi:hypothetical protein
MRKNPSACGNSGTRRCRFPGAARDRLERTIGTTLASGPCRQSYSNREDSMIGYASAYVVAICAMLFAAISALSLIHAVKHLDS